MVITWDQPCSIEKFQTQGCEQHHNADAWQKHEAERRAECAGQHNRGEEDRTEELSCAQLAVQHQCERKSDDLQGNGKPYPEQVILVGEEIAPRKDLLFSRPTKRGGLIASHSTKLRQP